MEIEPLESLKQEWGSYAAHQEHRLALDREGLRDLLRVQVVGSLKRIRRNMWLDAVVMVLVTAGFVGLVFWYRFQLRYVATGVFLVTAFLLVGHFWVKYRALGPLDLSEGGLVEAVRKLISRLERYVRAYLWGIPMVSVLSYVSVKVYLFGYVQGHFTFGMAFFRELLLVFPIGLVAYGATWWLVRRMYGRHLEVLRESYRDFLREAGEL